MVIALVLHESDTNFDGTTEALTPRRAQQVPIECLVVKTIYCASARVFETLRSRDRNAMCVLRFDSFEVMVSQVT